MEAPIYFVVSSAGIERTHYTNRDDAVAEACRLKEYRAYRDLTVGVVEVYPSTIMDGTQVFAL